MILLCQPVTFKAWLHTWSLVLSVWTKIFYNNIHSIFIILECLHEKFYSFYVTHWVFLLSCFDSNQLRFILQLTSSFTANCWLLRRRVMGSNDSIAILIPSSSFFALCIWCLISANSSNISLTIGFCLSGTWANHSMAMSKIWLAVPVIIPAFIAVLCPWNKWMLGGTIAVAIYLVQPDKSSRVVWFIQYSVCCLLNLKSEIWNPQK